MKNLPLRSCSSSIGFTTIGMFASLGIASLASAQALPGEQLKFQQLPLGDLVTNPKSAFPGQDVPSTASLSTAAPGFTGTFAADLRGVSPQCLFLNFQREPFSFLFTTADPSERNEFLHGYPSRERTSNNRPTLLSIITASSSVSGSL